MSGRRFVCATLCVLALASCQKPSPTAEPVDESPQPPTPVQRIAALQAEIGIVSAIESAAAASLREMEGQGEEVAKTVPPGLVNPSTRKLTIFFGANNHGERNDCGCRKNPLGGLGRRHAMLDALTADATPIWGEAGPAVGPVFHVDAGDALFANNTLDRAAEAAQKIAKYDAESVVAALRTYPLDAYLVGEHDLVFGLDYLRKLTRDADFPLLSANLRGADGQLAFAPSVVVERDGLKVAFVGATPQTTRRADYWAARDLTVDEPSAAIAAAVRELGPRDATVLLSNLGLADTQTLVGQLVGDGVRLDLAIVSGTGRSTTDPEFAAGVPIMEPHNRGKYLGRADLFLNGETAEYRNAAIATPSAMRDYRRAVRSYWTTRKQELRERLKIAELELSLHTLERGQQPDAGAAVDQLTQRRRENIGSLEKRLSTFETRRTNTSQAMMMAVANVRPPSEAPVGDDWIAGWVVPVKIEITPEPATRKVLDQRERKRPKADPKFSLPGE